MDFPPLFDEKSYARRCNKKKSQYAKKRRLKHENRNPLYPEAEKK
jgi:hypothetical protein